MITGEAFTREMRRATRPSDEPKAMGLRIPVWMANEMGTWVKEDLWQSLYGEAVKQLRDDEDLAGFVDWLLKENAVGRIKYFPKLSELKVALHQYLESEHRVPARPFSRTWVPPPAGPDHAEVAAALKTWWDTLGDEGRQQVRRELLEELVRDGQVFVAEMLEARDEGWRDPSTSVLVRAHLMDYYRRHRGVRAA